MKRRGPSDDGAKETPHVEELKSALRLEETLPDAEACPGCAEARRESGDPTALCRPHLARVLGV